MSCTDVHLVVGPSCHQSIDPLIIGNNLCTQSEHHCCFWQPAASPPSPTALPYKWMAWKWRGRHTHITLPEKRLNNFHYATDALWGWSGAGPRAHWHLYARAAVSNSTFWKESWMGKKRCVFFLLFLNSSSRRSIWTHGIRSHPHPRVRLSWKYYPRVRLFSPSGKHELEKSRLSDRQAYVSTAFIANHLGSVGLAIFLAKCYCSIFVVIW